MRPNQQDSAQEEWIARLCPQCGLCCNGILFEDVRLVRGDKALVLEKGGLKLRRHGRKTAFGQPCPWFDGRLCAAYDQRPLRCRHFDCHTLKQAAKRQITRADALARIREAKREVATVMRLLRALGQNDEHLPLVHRYRLVMSEPVDLACGDKAAARRGGLMLAMSRLMERLQRDFLALSH
jgi:Fe-S-cluster containining protein